MGSNGKFWVSVNAIIAATVIIIVFLSTSYWKDHNKKVVDMIGSGVNPVAAMCAMQDDYGKMPVCIILATQEK